MTKEDNIIVPRWFLEVVENTLRIQNNINLDKDSPETCQDRNIHQSLNGIRKLLKGEELTGMERLEKLQSSIPSNLDEAALKAYPKMSRLSEPHGVIPADNKTHYLGDANEENRDAFKAGAEWMTKQGVCADAAVCKLTNRAWVTPLNEKQFETDVFDNFVADDKVIIQIRKKEE